MNQFPEAKTHHRLQYVLWIAFLLANIYTMLALMPDSLEKIRGASPNGESVTLPDKTPRGFTSDELYYFLDKIGETGRQEYLRFHLTIDLMFPFLYGLFLALTIRILSTHVTRRKLTGWLLPIVPVLALVADLAENHHLHILTQQFPDFSPLLVMRASFFNILKWNLVYISVLLIIALVAMYFVNKKRRLPQKVAG